MRDMRAIFTEKDDAAQMLDPIDIKLLAALQKDAHLTAQELGELLNLSPSQAGRRRQRLEADGYIQGYIARLDPLRLGLAVQGFVQVHLGSHGPEQSASFARLIATRAEITSAWTMTGDAGAEPAFTRGAFAPSCSCKGAEPDRNGSAEARRAPADVSQMTAQGPPPPWTLSSIKPPSTSPRR